MPSAKEKVEITIRWDGDVCNDEEGWLCDAASPDGQSIYHCAKHGTELMLYDEDMPMRCAACQKEKP